VNIVLTLVLGDQFLEFSMSGGTSSFDVETHNWGCNESPPCLKDCLGPGCPHQYLPHENVSHCTGWEFSLGKSGEANLQGLGSERGRGRDGLRRPIRGAI